MQIFNEDCFNIFPKLEPNSIDLIVVDLPYGQTSCKWDSVIDLDKMWIELKRICTKKCIYVFFCTTKFGFTIIKSNPKWFRYDLVWYKSKKVGFLSANKSPLRQHEMMYVMGDPKGTHKTYNPQKVLGKPYTHKKTKQKDIYGAENVITINKGDRHPTSILEFEPDHKMMYVMGDPKGTHKTYNPQKVPGKPYTHKGRLTAGIYGDVKSIPTKNDGTRYPSTILQYKNPTRSLHRTQKPVKLLEFLIKSYSNENDTVLDFTAGSMSCGVACLNTNRKCIMIERDEDIFKIGKKRIEEHTKKLKEEEEKDGSLKHK